MSNIKLINNIKEIDLSHNWTDSFKFNSEDRFVDEKGKYVDATYEGKKYKLISKKERDLHYHERFGRGLLGTAIVIGTLGFAFFSESVRNLFLKQKEKIRFALPVDNADRLETEKRKSFNAALFPLHRQIESQYHTLPWPKEIQKIVVFTDLKGGRGDFAAAEKAIDLMQSICPTLTFDWILKGDIEHKPLSFLRCPDASKITVRNFMSTPKESVPGDFLLTGPVRLVFHKEYIASRINREINGPLLNFMEIGEDSLGIDPKALRKQVKEELQKTDKEIYQHLHPHIFLNQSGIAQGLPMGFLAGSGVLLDKDRIDAKLSRDYCCPSYLSKIADIKLRNDILASMHVSDGSPPDFDQHSFNLGYAHHSASWGKFIDCVAIHEKDKHVVIVLNQSGALTSNSTQEFKREIFGSERLELLKRKGYGCVMLKGEDGEETLLQPTDPSTRRLTVIIRHSFTTDDMMYMQLASERLLATGDNSAVEAWSARCKLFLYEDVDTIGCKWRFLQQQVDLAGTISPTLSRLLALFGGDRRLPDRSINTPLNSQKMCEIEQLLNDPDLGEATLRFCNHIIENYSFSKVLEAALKRTAWHHCIPDLAKIEAEAIDEEFQSNVVDYLKNASSTKKTLHFREIQELGRRVHEAVRQYSEGS